MKNQNTIHWVGYLRRCHAWLAWFCLVVGTLASARAETFTIPVLPDTQEAVRKQPAMFHSQLKWLLENREALRFPVVLHVGDIVDWDTPEHVQWEEASKGFTLLDEAGLPYLLANGNHDGEAVKVGGSAAPGNVNANLRKTGEYNRYFPPARFKLQQGAYEPGKSENSFATFSAGGVDWLVLLLELWPRQGPIDWAKGVVEAHPDHNVIVLTHSFLTSNGTIKKDNGGYGDTSPRWLYEQLIRPYANMRLVLSGHVDSSAWHKDTGIHGNTVYEVLQDYQNTDNGGGYIRLLEVDTEKQTISARMYSPFYNLTKDDGSAFVLPDLNFVKPPKKD